MIFIFKREEGSSVSGIKYVDGTRNDKTSKIFDGFRNEGEPWIFQYSKKGANYRRASQTSFSFYSVQVQTLLVTTNFTKKSRFKFYLLDKETTIFTREFAIYFFQIVFNIYISSFLIVSLISSQNEFPHNCNK